MRKLLSVAILALAGAALASAQSKVGVLNAQKALLDTEDIKKAQKDLETKYKPRQDEIAKLDKELQDIQSQLQSGRLNEVGAQELTAQGQRKQRELQRLQQDLQEDVDRERNDILQRAGTRMQDVVTKVAQEKGLDVVIDSASTHFFKAALDITNDAVAAYNKTYPVTAAAAAK
ncbi:MAG TPA: OmpH family outer membrane protein [Bryobacteraceae bacterium]|nr:OmpH family outer membrane protein [Bryobacteraceae bacterium]